MEVTHHAQPPFGWDDFLKSQPCGSVFQTTAYASYLEKYGQRKVHYFQAHHGSDVSGQLLVFENSALHGAPKRFRPLLRLADSFFHQLSWIGGPCAKTPESFQALLENVAHYAKERRLPIVSAQPHPLFDSDAFQKTGFVAEKHATFLIDLSAGPEALLANVDKAARKIVRRTAEDGVTVRELSSEKDFHDYVSVVNQSRKRAGIAPYAYSEVQGVFDSLNPAGIYAVFGAFKENRLLAGLGISFFNGYLYEWGAGTSDEAMEKHIYASDLIKWHVIEWGAKAGHRYFDLSGVSAKHADQMTDKERGIFRFKEKWGGKLVFFNEYSLPVERKRDQVLTLGKGLFR